MAETRKKYSVEFKKTAVRMSYETSESVRMTAKKLGITGNRLYAWREKYTAEGRKTKSAELEEEIKKLRCKNLELSTENDMFKKSRALYSEPAHIIYDFIWRHTEYPVAKWTEFLNVSRSGYYAYVDRNEKLKLNDEMAE